MIISWYYYPDSITNRLFSLQYDGQNWSQNAKSYNRTKLLPNFTNSERPECMSEIHINVTVSLILCCLTQH